MLGLAWPALVRAVDLYAFGGYWSPADGEGIGGAGVGMSLPLFTSRVRLDGRLGRYGRGELAPSGEEAGLIPLDLGVQVHLMPGSDLDPYVLGGVSYVFVDGGGVDGGAGGYLGAGCDVAVGVPLLRLFGEVVYRFGDLDNPFGPDPDAAGFGGNLGLKLHF